MDVEKWSVSAGLLDLPKQHRLTVLEAGEADSRVLCLHAASHSPFLC